MTDTDHRARFARDFAALVRLAPSVVANGRVLIDEVDGLTAKLTLEIRSPLGVWTPTAECDALRKQWEVMSLWNRATGCHYERRTDLKRQEEE